jgi:hypothetical protein
MLRLAILATALFQPAVSRSSGRRVDKSSHKAKLTKEHALAAQLLADRRLSEALASFDRAVRTSPNVHRDTRALRAKALAMAERLPEALEEVNALLDPANPGGDDPSWYGEQWFMRGTLMQQMMKVARRGQAEGSLGAMTQATMRFQVDAAESLRTAYRVLPVPERDTNHELLNALCVAHHSLNLVTDTTLFEGDDTHQAKPLRWKAGMVVDFETQDGWERGVEILGPSESGDATEMSVKFADGSVDDWETVEFILHASEPTEAETNEDRPSPNSKTGYLSDGVRFCDEVRLTSTCTLATHFSIQV